jgi:hypothetical protein
MHCLQLTLSDSRSDSRTSGRIGPCAPAPPRHMSKKPRSSILDRAWCWPFQVGRDLLKTRLIEIGNNPCFRNTNLPRMSDSQSFKQLDELLSIFSTDYCMYGGSLNAGFRRLISGRASRKSKLRLLRMSAGQLLELLSVYFRKCMANIPSQTF